MIQALKRITLFSFLWICIGVIFYGVAELLLITLGLTHDSGYDVAAITGFVCGFLIWGVRSVYSKTFDRW